jgi:SAM-dependent methyltransferase
MLTCPLRRFQYDPATLLASHVREGMTVLEPGPGMGFFTLELARKVGGAGRVIVLDIQQRMLDGLRRRAARARLLGRIEARLTRPDTLGIEDLAGTIDFVLAYYMVHEVPSAAVFFAEVAQALRPGGTALLAEPAGHVGMAEFEAELQAAAAAGLAVVERPEGGVRWRMRCQAAVPAERCATGCEARRCSCIAATAATASGRRAARSCSMR